MDARMKVYVFGYILMIIVMSTSHAGFDDEMKALEKDLKMEDMKKSSQKKSVQDMTTEELIEELKRGIDKEEKKSHTERFHDIVTKTTNDDFEKLLAANTMNTDTSKTKLKKKSTNTLKVESKDTMTKKQSQDATQKKSADTIKTKTVNAKKTTKRESDEKLVKKAILTIRELKKADVNDLTAQKKGLELLQELMKADDEVSRKRGASSIIEKIRIANEAVEKEETAKFTAAINADKTMLKRIADEEKANKKKEEMQKKEAKKEEAKKDAARKEEAKKALTQDIKEAEKNKVEGKETKYSLMDEVLNLMAEDLVKEIADEVDRNDKRSMNDKHTEQKSDTYLKCADTRNDCDRLLVFCDDYKVKLQNVCAKSCRFCEPCRDNWSGTLAHRCRIIVNQEMCPRKGVEKYCRKSCGYCKIPAPPLCSHTKYGCCWDKTTIKKDGKGSNCPSCKNQYKYVCHRFRKECYNTNKAGSFMRHHCPEACALCTDTCRDDPKKAFYCPFWKKDLQWCTKRKEVMKHFCPVTCGLC